MLENIFKGFYSDYKKMISNEIVTDYKRFVGEDELKELLTKFNKKEFSIENTWNQVMGSFTTSLLGSGFGSTSITAEYDKLDEDTISVLNRALTDSLQDIYVIGISKPRDTSVPTCRTVSFDSNGIEGDYWILYINDRLDTFIVVAPLIIPETSIKVIPIIACYILTSKSHSEFWSDKKNVKEIFDITEKYGFNNIFIKPLATPKTLEQGTLDEAFLQR
jgi:hypothetical protein